MGAEEPSEAQIARVVGLVEDAGGLAYARERAQGFAQQAEAELDSLSPSPARDALRSSVTYVLERRR
jgi:geranylgeranyl pyrophosphate synthase